MGVLNGISNVAGIVAPLAVAQLTGNSVSKYRCLCTQYFPFNCLSGGPCAGNLLFLKSFRYQRLYIKLFIT